jgi:hypothetical protein
MASNRRGIIMAAPAKAKVRRIERIGSFRATDERGELHTLHVFASLFEVGPPAGRPAGTQGTRSIRTEDGELMERIIRGEYRTAWGETLRSDDPDAP